MADGAYTIGTVSITNGSPTLTGAGTAWVQSGFKAGDKLYSAGYVMVIASVDSDTQITLTENWPGTTLAGAAYRLEFEPSLSRSASTYAEAKAALNSAPPMGIVQSFSSITTAADPGDGLFRLDNADPASATAAYLDNLDSFGSDISAELDTWSGGTLKIVQRGNAAVFATYTVSAVVDSTGYRTLTLTAIDNGGVFTSGAVCLIGFALAGVTQTLASLGLKNGQTDATLQVRKGGNAIEFGHTNPAGYGSTIGAEAGNGKPFIALNAEAGTTDNTYRTRGFKGFVTRGNLAGGIDFLSIPNTNADNQAPTLLGGISATGALSGLTMTQAQISDLAATPAPLYIGFYNGQSDYTTPANTYNIGVATASDPLAFGRKNVLAPVWDDATTYLDSSGHQNPHPVRVGDEIWVYYEGYDGTRKRIFMLRTDLYGNLREKPLMPVIDYTDVSGANSIDRPAVLYDPSDATWPFKMVLSKATSGTNPTALVAAHSADGFSWTTIGEIANVASGAAWENTYIETTGRLLKDGSTYRLFYSGHNGTFWQSGEMHSTDFATWTKNAANPLLAPRGGYLQALTADTVAGTKTIKVANSALFDVGAPIALCETGSGTSFQTNRIAAIPDGTTLTTLETIQGNYTTTLPSAVSQITGRSVEFSELWKEDGVWKALIVGFQFIKAGQVIETMAYAEGPADLSAAFTIHPAEWPLPLIEKRKVWDQRSAENLKFVRVQ